MASSVFDLDWTQRNPRAWGWNNTNSGPWGPQQANGRQQLGNLISNPALVFDEMAPNPRVDLNSILPQVPQVPQAVSPASPNAAPQSDSSFWEGIMDWNRANDAAAGVAQNPNQNLAPQFQLDPNAPMSPAWGMPDLPGNTPAPAATQGVPGINQLVPNASSLVSQGSGVNTNPNIVSRGLDWLGNFAEENKAGLEALQGAFGLGEQAFNLYNTWNRLGMAKDWMRTNKRLVNTNLENQTSSYNTALEDRARARQAFDPSFNADEYIDKHKLAQRRV